MDFRLSVKEVEDLVLVLGPPHALLSNRIGLGARNVLTRLEKELAAYRKQLELYQEDRLNLEESWSDFHK